ncbi:MAG TPA: hypothetical protein VJ927_02475 [Actinomycetota bacterium]|nr:hypothetical protein [Actinomycetota bacterium]
MDGLWFALFVGVAVAIAGGRYYFKEQRKRGLATFARRHGFVFTPHAPQGLLSHSFPLFLSGNGRGAENGIAGEWRDMSFKAADFWYYQGSSPGDQQTKGGTRYYRFSVAATGIPSWLPELTISRETLTTSVGKRIRPDDIDFESEEFNRAFRIKTQHRRFAFELIDARMMEWLLTCDRRLGFQVRGRGVLAYSKPLAPHELLVLVGSLKEFCDRIPRLVWNSHDFLPPSEGIV